ncbi:MAG: NAD(P)H-quinone oxidoreductase [Chloroflexi bacterium]|nr:NAD(P)H-quinone oxidoreductase [Chloroflexota bacterium]MCH8194582.1 NAD(P)H-quinone oxidoreductase [Chloroflexota bacterium]
MRAAVITQPGGPEVLQVQEVEEPQPGPDEILVDVKASALNRADLLQRGGRYPGPADVRADIPGLEMAGVVAAVGGRVTGLTPGDRVFALLGGGGYAQRAVIHQAMAVSIPERLDFQQAASMPEVFFTAYDALFNWCRLSMGERALIHAAGSGVGVAAIQLAREAGAVTFGTASSAEKLRRAAELGLDVGINYRDEDFADVVRQKTGGRGVDVVLDVIGAPYWDRNIASMALKGRMVLVGTMGGGQIETNVGALMPKRLSVFGTVLRMRSLGEKIVLTEQFRRHVLPLIESGKVRPVIDRVFPLEQAADAHRYMETNANFGKIVLTMD